MAEMNWYNLRQNLCPKCGKDFVINLITVPVARGKILQHGCGFKILESNYMKIVSKQTDSIIESSYEYAE